MIQKRGTMLRLIDVVFILLFGFLSISEINRRGIFQLPRKSEVETEAPVPTSIVVEISKDGDFICGNEKLVLDEKDPAARKELLRGYIQDEYNQRADKEGVFVEIRSDREAAIQYAVDVKDVCDNLGIISTIGVVVEEH
jgi:biopolymer transport protein ExbD